MSMIMLLGALSASLAGADGGHLHRTTIEHRGVPMSVDYRATTAITTRQIGMAPPTRMGVARCNWVAKVVVERHMARAGAEPLRRVVDSDYQMKGSRPGTCAGAKSAIEREVATRDGELRQHVLAVAAKDRSTLVAELEAATGPGAS